MGELLEVGSCVLVGAQLRRRVSAVIGFWFTLQLWCVCVCVYSCVFEAPEGTHFIVSLCLGVFVSFNLVAPSKTA